MIPHVAWVSGVTKANQAPSSDEGPIRHAPYPSVAVNPGINVRRRARNTMMEAPVSVRDIAGEDTSDTLVFSQTDIVAESTMERFVNAELISGAIESKSDVPFRTRPRRAERIKPVGRTTMASSQIGQSEARVSKTYRIQR